MYLSLGGGLDCLFLLGSAIPAIHEIGPAAFLLGQKWKPGNDMYGILPMILGSVYVTAGALIVGVRWRCSPAFSWPGFARPSCTGY